MAYWNLGGNAIANEFYYDTKPFIDEGRYITDKYIWGKKKWGIPKSRLTGNYEDWAFKRQAHHAALRKQLREDKTLHRRAQIGYHRSHLRPPPPELKRRAPFSRSATRNVRGRVGDRIYELASHRRRAPRRTVSSRRFSNWYKPHAFYPSNRIQLF